MSNPLDDIRIAREAREAAEAAERAEQEALEAAEAAERADRVQEVHRIAGELHLEIMNWVDDTCGLTIDQIDEILQKNVAQQLFGVQIEANAQELNKLQDEIKQLRHDAVKALNARNLTAKRLEEMEAERDRLQAELSQAQRLFADHVCSKQQLKFEEVSDDQLEKWINQDPRLAGLIIAKNERNRLRDQLATLKAENKQLQQQLAAKPATEIQTVEKIVEVEVPSEVTEKDVKRHPIYTQLERDVAEITRQRDILDLENKELKAKKGIRTGFADVLPSVNLKDVTSGGVRLVGKPAHNDNKHEKVS